jgi:hypothetical protein
MNIRLCKSTQTSKSIGRRRSPESVSGLSANRRAIFIILSCLLPLATDAIISRLTTPLRANESDRSRVFRERLRNFLVTIRNVARFLGVINAFAFIRHGYFRTLPTRMSGGCVFLFSLIICSAVIRSMHPERLHECLTSFSQSCAYPSKLVPAETRLSNSQTSHLFGKVIVPLTSMVYFMSLSIVTAVQLCRTSFNSFASPCQYRLGSLR